MRLYRIGMLVLARGADAGATLVVLRAGGTEQWPLTAWVVGNQNTALYWLTQAVAVLVCAVLLELIDWLQDGAQTRRDWAFLLLFVVCGYWCLLALADSGQVLVRVGALLLLH